MSDPGMSVVRSSVKKLATVGKFAMMPNGFIVKQKVKAIGEVVYDEEKKIYVCFIKRDYIKLRSITQRVARCFGLDPDKLKMEEF